MPKLELATWGLLCQEAATQLRSFLIAQGDCEILRDALNWNWPLLLELLGPAGLPENVQGCRELMEAQLELAPEAIPELPPHALEDPRWLSRLAEAGTNPV